MDVVLAHHLHHALDGLAEERVVDVRYDNADDVVDHLVVFALGLLWCFVAELFCRIVNSGSLVLRHIAGVVEHAGHRRNGYVCF
ncbi:hypothetical protein SDC9_199588 [bioreactor metagenome]|uniref:Uncharacterized protein n=1 Tax=bioreactor metagenome TaxID=1076179 RepID=A0A645IKY9_9ZZZZ